MMKPPHEKLKEKISLLEKELAALRSVSPHEGNHAGNGSSIDVKIMEKALRDSEEKFSKAFDSNPSVLAINAIEGERFIDINRQFENILGYRRCEVTGRTAAELGLFPVPGEREAVVRQAREKGRARDVEIHVRAKDGTIITGLFYAEIITVGDRQCWLTMLNDISGRKKAEAALRESEEFLGSLADSIPGVVYQFYVRDNGEMGFHYISERAAGFLGQETVTDDVFGRFVAGMVPEDRERFLDSIRESARLNRIWEFEGRFIARNGRIRYFSGISHPRRSGGEVVFNGLMLDITGRKLAEQSTRESEEKFSRAFRLNPASSTISRLEDGLIMEVNDAFQKLTGYGRDEAVGKTSFELGLWNDPDDRERITRLLRDEGRVTDMELVFRKKEGARYIGSFSAEMIDIGGEVCTLTHVLDLTERKLAEERLKWQLAMNMALAGLSGSIIAQSFTIRDIAAIALEYARLLTDSEHGFVSEIDPDTRENVIHAKDGAPFGSANPGWKPEGADMRYAGLWGHVLNGGDAFYTNDPRSHEAWPDTREGDAGVRRFLGVPVLLDHAVVGEIVLANASRDYTGDDLITARRLASLYAMAIGRIRSEKELRESLHEKEILIKELHHRVKNNLQVVSSLLALQSNRIESDLYRGYFQESQNRVHAMALVHEKLYNSAALSRIDFSQYIEDLTRHLFYSYNINPQKVRLRIDVRDVYLGIDTAVPCAMIINELVSNSLKHAFPGGREGEVVVAISGNAGSGYTLTVGDTGVGMPEEHAGAASASLGMQIVSSLTKQIKGTMEVKNSGGTGVTITF